MPNFIDKEILEIRDNAKYCCYCGKEFNHKITKTIDHLIPKSKGGKIELNNIAICCHYCNDKLKGNLDLNDFLFLRPITKAIFLNYLKSVRNRLYRDTIINKFHLIS